MQTIDDRQRRYRRFAWGMLFYTLAVILWGTFVRASLSGDGCGEHWPLCNGEVIPVNRAVKTWIELMHRVTSGLAWIGSLILYLWARRLWSGGHASRRFAGWTFVFMCVESLVGAALVLLRLVASNPDIARAYWMGAHLLNTFLLVAAMVFAALTASGRPAPRLRGNPAAFGIVIAAVGMLVVGTTGAVTALGDTVFRPSTLGAGLHEDIAVARDTMHRWTGVRSTGAVAETHLFVRLRVIHPLLALAEAAWLLFVAGSALGRLRDRAARQAGMAVAGIVLVQVALGFLNVSLLAPVWLQLVHLGVADALWVALMAFWSLSSVAEAPHEA